MHLSQGRGWGWRERDGGALPYEMEIRSGSSIDSAVTPGLLVALVCVVKSPSKPLTVWVFQLQCRSEVKEQGHSEASACRGSRTSCESKPARLNVLRAALYFLTFSNGKLLTFLFKKTPPKFIWSQPKNTFPACLKGEDLMCTNSQSYRHCVCSVRVPVVVEPFLVLGKTFSPTKKTFWKPFFCSENGTLFIREGETPKQSPWGKNVFNGVLCGKNGST